MKIGEIVTALHGYCEDFNGDMNYIMFVWYLATLHSARMSQVLDMWSPLFHSTGAERSSPGSL